jgi:hypothetical protein
MFFQFKQFSLIADFSRMLVDLINGNHENEIFANHTVCLLFYFQL